MAINGIYSISANGWEIDFSKHVLWKCLCGRQYWVSKEQKTLDCACGEHLVIWEGRPPLPTDDLIWCETD